MRLLCLRVSVLCASQINLCLLVIIPSLRLSCIYISVQLILVSYANLIASQVRNSAARKVGLEVSLFCCLSAVPHGVIDLTHQYRKNKNITLLSNRSIYGDRLKCGTEEVAWRTLVLPDSGKYLRKMYIGKPASRKDCWMDKLLSERCVADSSLD
jgi:hypothetical protein